jgi:hypothetical protein
MKSLLRPSHLDEVLRSNVGPERRRELIVDPEGGIFGVKNLATAIRRATRGDVICVPSGEYPAFEITKAVEIRSQQGAPVQFKGQMKIRTEGLVILSGIAFQAGSGSRAIELAKGSLLLDDCTVNGEISSGSDDGRTELFLRNCLAGNAPEGINASRQSTVEIHTSRITGCHAGISLLPGASGAIYDSRIESCLSVDESSPGAAISAESASLYCEGVSFARNTIGVYLSNCPEARFLCSDFYASETAALIAANDPSATPLQIHTCSFRGQTTSRCAQIALTGGAAVIKRLTAEPAPAAALSVDQTRLEIFDSRLAADNAPALDALSSHLTARTLTAESHTSAGLAADACQGILRDCVFSGQPPVAVGNSLQLILESCESRENPSEAPAADAAAQEAAAGIAEVMQSLRTSVSQDVVRNELERILRLAHASQQRRLGGLPVPNQSYHSIFMGPPGTGKLNAARLLAEGLHTFGVLPSSEVEEIALARVNGTHQPHAGIVFIRAKEAVGTEPENQTAREAIERLIATPGEIVILGGERDEIRRLMRQSATIERAFRHTVFFTAFGPLELAALFAQLCERDRIPLSVEAMRTVLLAFHLYCERRDRRYANIHGVETLYENTRRRYLGRCSVAQRVDLELEPRDMEIPQDKALLTALERCPAFVSFCPACARENTWLPGLSGQVHCLHCDTPYTAQWGVWKDSASYRRMKETLHRTAENTPAPRASLPPVH